MEQNKTGKQNSKGPLIPALSSTRSYYPGSRRLPNLPDGREVWQAFVGSLWRTYYEFPMDGTDLARIRGRLATTSGRWWGR
jgi:hypothetical protein